MYGFYDVDGVMRALQAMRDAQDKFESAVQGDMLTPRDTPLPSVERNKEPEGPWDSPEHTSWVISVDLWGRVSVLESPRIH